MFNNEVLKSVEDGISNVIYIRLTILILKQMNMFVIHADLISRSPTQEVSIK